MMTKELEQVHQMIAALPHDSRTRVHVTAQILRDLLAADETDESMLAFTLVMAEVSQ